MGKSTLKHKPSILSVSSLILLSLYAFTIVAIFVWAIVFSLTDYMEDIFIANEYFVWPKHLNFKNYVRVYEVFSVQVEAGIGYRLVMLPEMFLNSILYAAGTAFFGMLAPCIMGYITQRFHYKFNAIIDAIVMITLILPIVGSLPSSMRIVYGLSLNDSFFGFWIMGFSFTNMYYFVFKATFKAVPSALSEAAYIDGANNLKIFFMINIPLVKTTMLTVFTVMFVGNWNTYTTQIAYAPNLPTISYGLYRFIHGSQISEPTLMMAGAMLLLVPILVFYVLGNKFMMGNLTVGSLK